MGYNTRMNCTSFDNHPDVELMSWALDRQIDLLAELRSAQHENHRVAVGLAAAARAKYDRRIMRDLREATGELAELFGRAQVAAAQNKVEAAEHKLGVERVDGHWYPVCSCGGWRGPICYFKQDAEKDAELERRWVFRPLTDRLSHERPSSMARNAA